MGESGGGGGETVAIKSNVVYLMALVGQVVAFFHSQDGSPVNTLLVPVSLQPVVVLV